MKHLFKSALFLISVFVLNSCGDDGVVKPATTPAATVDPNKGCFLKSSTYDDDDHIKITYNASNQVTKLGVESFFGEIEANYTYNTDGTVAKISSDEIDYEFVYDKTVLTKINEKEGGVLFGERIITFTGGKASSIAYYEIEGTKKTLEYTHKFTYTKGNISKYILNVGKVDLDYSSDIVYDTKLNPMTKLSKAADAFMYALTDNFVLLPTEEILNFSSTNNFVSGKFRPEIFGYIAEVEDPALLSIVDLNKQAPILPFTNTVVYNKDNYPTSGTIKYKDPVDGEITIASKYTYDCK